MTRDFKVWRAGRLAQYGLKFEESDLNTAFIPAFESGDRVMLSQGGNLSTGWVGVTGGRRPAFLLLSRPHSRDSYFVIGMEAKPI